jgi:hypothetical protein
MLRVHRWRVAGHAEIFLPFERWASLLRTLVYLVMRRSIASRLSRPPRCWERVAVQADRGVLSQASNVLVFPDGVQRCLLPFPRHARERRPQHHILALA